MKWLVQNRQNLTACDTIHRSGSTQRTISEELFDTEEAALAAYQSQRNMLRFAGLAGQYVTYPREVEDDYVIHTHTCDHCGERFSLREPADDNPHDDSHLGYTDLPGGDFCSRSCFRSAYEPADPYGESYDEEPYYED